MSWSYRIARIAGIEIRIHVTFFILLAWIAFAHYARGGPQGMVQGVVFVCALFACVLLHELGHAFAAARYGIKTPDITLLPIGGVARLQRMPEHPVQELVVAIAGPLVNVIIALGLAIGLGAAERFWSPNLQVDNPHIPLLQQLRNVNVWLVLFNLIPAFPMDGGRVLRALLAMRMPYARATAVAARVGQFMAFLFALWGLAIGNVLLVLIALFVYMGAAQEAAVTQMREAARGVPVGDAMVKEFRMLPTSATLADAVDLLLSTSQREFAVIDHTGKAIGLLTRDHLIAGLKESGPASLVTSAMRAGEVVTVRDDASLEEVFRVMTEREVPAVMVADVHGHPVGMVTPENVGELMMVQSALRESQPAWYHAPPPAAVRPQQVRPA